MSEKMAVLVFSFVAEDFLSESKHTDQTAHLCSLICVFAVHTCYRVL